LFERADAVEHFAAFSQVGYGQFLGSQFLGSQSFGSQVLGSQLFTLHELSFLISVLAFLPALFLPPSCDAIADKDNKQTASIATSIFFIVINIDC
jgi:hypothetical protein